MIVTYITLHQDAIKMGEIYVYRIFRQNAWLKPQKIGDALSVLYLLKKSQQK